MWREIGGQGSVSPSLGQAAWVCSLVVGFTSWIPLPWLKEKWQSPTLFPPWPPGSRDKERSCPLAFRGAEEPRRPFPVRRVWQWWHIEPSRPALLPTLTAQADAVELPSGRPVLQDTEVSTWVFHLRICRWLIGAPSGSVPDWDLQANLSENQKETGTWPCRVHAFHPW